MDSSSAVLPDVELVPELDQLTLHTSTAGSCGAGRKGGARSLYRRVGALQAEQGPDGLASNTVVWSVTRCVLSSWCVVDHHLSLEPPLSARQLVDIAVISLDQVERCAACMIIRSCVCMVGGA